MRPCGHRTKDESWASGRAHSEIGSEWGQSWNKTREERSRLMSWAARGQGCLYWRLSWVGRHSLADICQKVRVCSLTPTRHRNLQGVQLKNFNLQHFPAVQGINPWVTEWWGFLGHPWERPGSGWWFFHCLLCPTLYNPMDCSTPGFPVLHHLPELAQTHVHWVGDAIQPSSPLSFSSPPAFYLSQHQSLFPVSWLLTSGGQSIEASASASASVLPMNIQGWFLLELTGLISLLSKGLSRVFSNTTVQKHQFFRFREGAPKWAQSSSSD